jgi:hypothetical protein
MVNLVGIDVGYGFCKVYGGIGKQFKFSAGYLEYDNDDFSLGDKKEVLEFEGKKYLMGEEAVSQGCVVSHNPNDRLRHILSILYSIARVNDGEDFEGDIVLGLPLSDKANKITLEQMSGSYSIFFNEKEIKITINKVFVLPQGGACYYDLILDDNGKVVNNFNGKQISIIDIGEKTCDFVSFLDGKLINKDSKSQLFGIDKAKQTFLDVLLKTKKVNVKFSELPRYIHNNKAEYLKEVKKLTNEIIAYISHYWQFDNYDKIFISGGGGVDTVPFFQANFNAYLIEDSQFSNARGYYKCGQNLRNS